MERSRGFTLIEAMVVMAITALTLTIGIPSFTGVLERQRVGTALHLLSADFAAARSAAIMSRQQIVVCPGSAADGCRNDRDWNQGWIVFRDTDKNRQPDSDSDLIRAEEARRTGDRITIASTRAYLRYQADGRSANTNLSVRICVQGVLKGEVVVNNTGRVRTERPLKAATCEG